MLFLPGEIRNVQMTCNSDQLILWTYIYFFSSKRFSEKCLYPYTTDSINRSLPNI